MEGLRTGLRHRLERALRRVEEQHRQLRDVDAELARAAGTGTTSEIADWLERKRDALLAHFEWEEKVVFPAVHGLLPGTGDEIDKLERDHGLFLDRLRGAMDAKGGQAIEEIETLRRLLEKHEQHEERLVGLALAIEHPARS